MSVLFDSLLIKAAMSFIDGLDTGKTEKNSVRSMPFSSSNFPAL